MANITGTIGNNTLIGTTGNDTIFGLAGNDLIDGVAGNDVLNGGLGNDTINGGGGNDSIDGGAGSDILNGGAGNDILEGGFGNDTLNGGDGIDTANYANVDGPITLGALGVVTKAFGGTDSLVAIERIVGSAGGGDTINAFTLAGIASINANLSAKSFVVNNAIATPLSFTVENFENVVGSINNDLIVGDAGNNLLDGGAGNDTLQGAAGNDTLEGALGNDVIIDLAGNNFLDGGAGNDTLTAGAGNDTLNGGFGADQLTSGNGSDVFAFRFGQSIASGIDRITDFAFGADKIQLFSPAGVAAQLPNSISLAANNSLASIGALANAVYTDANGDLAGNQALAAGRSALVVSTGAGVAGTYLIVDNGIGGYQANQDLVINVTGYTGNLLGANVNQIFV
jgi:Ca2+-binding RTX toxin-like protein